jgi:hypothetical protein
MQQRVLSSSFCDEYSVHAKAKAHIANTAVSDQYLFTDLISDVGQSKMRTTDNADPQGWSVMSADAMLWIVCS